MEFDGPYTKEKIAEFEEKFKNLENVSILINNAGLATFGFCGSNDPWNYQSFLSCMYVDTFPIPIVTKLVLPKILARKVDSRRKGAVITVSSLCARGTLIKGMSVYSGVKAFDLRFSQILEKEYGQLVDVHCVIPGAVESNLNKEPTGIFAVTAKQYAQHSLAKIGYETESFGHWKHHMFQYYNAWRPTEWLIDTINARRRLNFLKKKLEAGKDLGPGDIRFLEANGVKVEKK